MDVERNAYGRQSHSQCREIVDASGVRRGAYFIRAPKIARVGPETRVLAHLVDGTETVAFERHEVHLATATPMEAVAVRQGNLMGTSFHPEISNDLFWFEMFLREVAGVVDLARTEDAGDASLHAPWAPIEYGVGDRCEAGICCVPEGRRDHGRHDRGERAWPSRRVRCQSWRWSAFPPTYAHMEVLRGPRIRP